MIIKVSVKFNGQFPYDDKVREFIYYKVNNRKFNKIFKNNVCYTWDEIVKESFGFAMDICDKDSACSEYHHSIESVTFFEICPIPFTF